MSGKKIEAAVEHAKAAELDVKWSFREHWWGESAEASVGDLRAVVSDCDGDFSTWSVTRGGESVEGGEHRGIRPYHFDVAMKSATKALKAHLQPLPAPPGAAHD